jgi:hypothetical protein
VTALTAGHHSIWFFSFRGRHGASLFSCVYEINSFYLVVPSNMRRESQFSIENKVAWMTLYFVKFLLFLKAYLVIFSQGNILASFMYPSIV